MVNLNAPRNLPPDTTPWGKAIERRLSELERENDLLKSEVKNNGKGLNNLNTRVGTLGVYAEFKSLEDGYNFPNVAKIPEWDDEPAMQTQYTYTGVEVTGYTASGRITVISSAGVNMNDMYAAILSAEITSGTGSVVKPYIAGDHGQLMWQLEYMTNPPNLKLVQGTVVYNRTLNIPPGDFNVRMGYAMKGWGSSSQLSMYSCALTVITH